MSEAQAKDPRLPALRRFAFAITLLNVLGHTWFGFEQAWSAPLVGIAAAYGTELLLESIVAWQQGRRPRFLAGSWVGTVDFMLSAHITGLAVAMLLYTGERMAPIVFGAAVAIASKYVLRVPAPDGGSRHFLNPSNFGITVTLLALTYVGISQPYMFTEHLNATGAWVLPAILVCAGSFLNGRFTHKLPLVAGWVGGFGIQVLARWALFGNLPLGSLMPMTGMALLLFTFYMVTDPATTPVPARRQVAFGLSVAAMYGVLLALHVVFAPFFALTLVSLGRGALLWAAARRARRARPETATRAAQAPPARPVLVPTPAAWPAEPAVAAAASAAQTETVLAGGGGIGAVGAVSGVGAVGQPGG